MLNVVKYDYILDVLSLLQKKKPSTLILKYFKHWFRTVVELIVIESGQILTLVQKSML